MNPFAMPQLVPPGVETVDTLQAIAQELHEEAEASYFVDTDADRGAKVAAAAGYIERAIALLVELEGLSPKLAAEVEALAALCTCGHDRGEHMAEAPHSCEACACSEACPTFTPAARPTERCIDDAPTDPPPAPEPMGAA